MVHKLNIQMIEGQKIDVLLHKNYFKDIFLKFKVGPWLP